MQKGFLSSPPWFVYPKQALANVCSAADQALPSTGSQCQVASYDFWPKQPQGGWTHAKFHPKAFHPNQKNAPAIHLPENWELLQEWYHVRFPNALYGGGQANGVFFKPWNLSPGGDVIGIWQCESAPPQRSQAQLAPAKFWGSWIGCSQTKITALRTPVVPLRACKKVGICVSFHVAFPKAKSLTVSSGAMFCCFVPGNDSVGVPRIHGFCSAWARANICLFVYIDACCCM